jgi:hypothetical protein
VATTVIDVTPSNQEDHGWCSRTLHQRRLLSRFEDDHISRCLLLEVLRRSAKAGGDVKTVYKRAAQELLEQYRQAKARRRTKRLKRLTTILDVLKSDPKAGIDLARNQQEWIAMPAEQRQMISLQRHAIYERERRQEAIRKRYGNTRCIECNDPIYLPASKLSGRCYRCRQA